MEYVSMLNSAHLLSNISMEDGRIMLSIGQLLSAVNCWLKCMLLDPYTQSDNPECKSRADTGLSAITEIDPGYITGMSTLFQSWHLQFLLDVNIRLKMQFPILPLYLEYRRKTHRFKISLETMLKSSFIKLLSGALLAMEKRIKETV